MKNQVITISREFGSGGRTIGREVAQRLNIPCYDEEIINRIAEESGLAKEFIKENGEYAPSGSILLSAMSGRDHNGHSLADDIWNAQWEIIKRVAEEGPCVIVGRCADYILRDSAECLTVFIHASMEKRSERIVKVYGDRKDAPEKRLRDKDKRRRAYYQVYTDMKWGDARNYQLALDSGILGLDKCVELIENLYKSRK